MRCVSWAFVSFVILSCSPMDKTIAIHNTEPIVTFEEPVEGDSFQVGEAIFFVAFVEDEESDSEELDIEWVSDQDGLLEEGSAISAEGETTFTTAGLSEGLHTVTLKATDPMGEIGSDYMTVKVETDCLALSNCDYDEDGYSEEQGDCDDNDDGRSPDADEIYNGIDDDCDDIVDEGTDGYDDDGDGYTEIEGDCDDDEPTTSPVAPEIEDGIDNNCDGQIDELTDVYDDDGDGYAEADGDCDDGDDDVYPEAEEVLNGVDDDCDGLIDEGTDTFDDDLDGYAEIDGDCDDDNILIHPGAEEICDGIDNDCDLAIDGDDPDTDQDEDTFSVCEDDCDDDDPDIHPEAVELCDDIDNDCDDAIDDDDPDTDWDEDGYSICDAVPDCNDGDEDIFPGGIEICDAFDVDEDCDGEINEPGAEGSSLFYADSDGDLYGNPLISAESCSAPEGYVSNNLDCDDSLSAVNPAAIEVCDDIDNDCDDGLIDAADPDTDLDEDGSSTCDAVPDCDDGNFAINPSATEVCDDVDNDCDGVTDGAGSEDATVYFEDTDGDGYGVSFSTQSACSLPDGYSTNGDDCDDGRSDVSPEGTEVCGDGLDNDCDWATDGEDSEMDMDEDGSTLCDLVPDCDDGDFAINPSATEVCDGVDNDCDGTEDEPGAAGGSLAYADTDFDSYGDPAVSLLVCSLPFGYVTNDFDCDDDAAAINPAATEICDGVDNDCDGDADEAGAVGVATYYRDVDSDGYGDASSTQLSCALPSGYSIYDTDCDDTEYDVNPGAAEVCDGVDNNCLSGIDETGAVDEPTWYYDGDEDGYGSTAHIACDPPSSFYVLDSGDCDDTRADINPSAPEVCDAANDDEDCDGESEESDALGESTWYFDSDGDGYGASWLPMSACDKPSGYVAVGGDCLSSDGDVYPGATESCDGIDNDCDTLIDEPNAAGCATYYRDYDGDGEGHETDSMCLCASGDVTYYDELTNEDCCDVDGDVYPGATSYSSSATSCGGYDYNCDGTSTKKWTTLGGCSSASSFGCYETPDGGGWNLTYSPSCGTTKNWIDDCDLAGPIWDLYCSKDLSSRTQQCR